MNTQIQGTPIDKGQLVGHFVEWMKMISDQQFANQRDLVEGFFNKFLQTLQLKESSHLMQFCQILVPYAIKRTFEFPSGEKRFLDRLDFCWIDGFIRLVFSLISTVQTINKHELMSWLLNSV